MTRRPRNPRATSRLSGFLRRAGTRLALPRSMDHVAKLFCRNSDGSWTCISAGTFSGPNGRIQVTPGSTFYPGTMFMGFDLATWLEASLDGQTAECSPLDEGEERRHRERRGSSVN